MTPKILSETDKISKERNGYLILKNEFLVHPKLASHVNFSNFQAEKICFIFKIFEMFRREKSSRNPPDLSILLKLGHNMS